MQTPPAACTHAHVCIHTRTQMAHEEQRVGGIPGWGRGCGHGVLRPLMGMWWAEEVASMLLLPLEWLVVQAPHCSISRLPGACGGSAGLKLRTSW